MKRGDMAAYPESKGQLTMTEYLVTFKPRATSGQKPQQYICEGTRAEAIETATLKLQALQYNPEHFFKGKAEKIKDLDREGFTHTQYEIDQAVDTIMGTPSPADATPVKVNDEANKEQSEGAAVSVEQINKQIAELKPGERLRLENVPADVYHKTTGYGSTAFKQAALSMAHLHAYINHPKQITPQQQAIFDFGSAFHSYVLETLKFHSEFSEMPEGMKKVGKAWQDFKSNNEERTIIPYDTMQIVYAMGEAVLSEPLLRQMLTTGNSEVSYWYRHESGVVLKFRTDHDHADYVADLKSTKDDTPAKFAKTVKYEYAVQDSVSRLVTGKEMVFVGCEKSYACSLYVVKQGEDVRERSDAKLADIIDQIAKAEKTNKWPRHNLAPITTELTNWELNNG